MDLGHDQLIALARTIKCVARNPSRALVVFMPFFFLEKEPDRRTAAESLALGAAAVQVLGLWLQVVGGRRQAQHHRSALGALGWHRIRLWARILLPSTTRIRSWELGTGSRSPSSPGTLALASTSCAGPGIKRWLTGTAGCQQLLRYPSLPQPCRPLSCAI